MRIDHRIKTSAWAGFLVLVWLAPGMSIDSRTALARQGAYPPQEQLQKSCSEILGIFPSTLKWFDEESTLQAAPRFELHECPGANIQVYGYEGNHKSPSFVFQTIDDKYVQLFHAFNVLVIQGLGGASDHVYVFIFKNGKPGLALRAATKGNVRAGLNSDRKSVVVEVPRVTYPNSQGKFPKEPPPDKYTYPIEY
jgi:hypothetical protein